MRKEIEEFAKNMEYKMALHDEERGDSWKKCSVEWLLTRLDEEVAELKERARKGAPDTKMEGPDVGNIAMMVSEAMLRDWAEKVASKMTRADQKAITEACGGYWRD